ncbi:MAG: hypothetical protein ACFFE2_04205 [Candidatus Thorarchaeota archaeon]
MNDSDSSRLAEFKSFLKSNRVLVFILIAAAVVWGLIFAQATYDYIMLQTWNGWGQFNIFGFTIHFQFEGWSDYSYYYQTWGDRFLSGFTPYSSAFDYVTVDHYVPYFFPPLYLYLCVLGNSLPIDPFGTAVLLCVFGFATAFPIYGIATFISDSKRIGEIAAATYLFNPLILFHTTYTWLNPAPFVFFIILSFYLLMKQHRLTGTLAMVTAALFKQTAFFLALPLIAYLIKTPPSNDLDVVQEADESRVLGDQTEVRGFLKMTVIVLVYFLIISFPYIIDFRNYFYYIFQRPGMSLFDDYTSLPAGNAPISFAVLFIYFGAPEALTRIINIATAYSLFIVIGVLITFVPMLLEVKDDRNLPLYWRRMLYFTLLMLLIVHIFSPRGIYKYYLVALIPFFSILSSERVITKHSEKIKTSLPMIINPFLLTIAILMPNRIIYLAVLILLLATYIFYKEFGLVYTLISEPLSPVRARIVRIFLSESMTTNTSRSLRNGR